MPLFVRLFIGLIAAFIVVSGVTSLWFLPEPLDIHTMDATVVFCVETRHGVLVAAKLGVDCPSADKIERLTQMTMDEMGWDESSLDGRAIIFVREEILCDGKIVKGCTDASGWVSYVQKPRIGGWARTMRHEQGHQWKVASQTDPSGDPDHRDDAFWCRLEGRGCASSRSHRPPPPYLF